MRVLLVTSRFPLPAQTGDRLRALRLIEHLGRGHEVHLVCMDASGRSAAELAQVGAMVQSLHVVRHGRCRMAAGLLGGLAGGLPLQVLLYRSPRLARVVERLVRERDIDVVVSQLVRISPNIETPVAHVVDYVDALSLGLDRRRDRSQRLIRPVLALDARRMRRLELREGQRADRRIVTSPVDAAYLEALGTGPVDVVPVGVSDDVDHRRGRPAPEQAGSDVVFTGNLGYEPNIRAAEFLVHEVVPRLLVDLPDLRVVVVGARPSRRVRRLESAHVRVVGPVDDLRPFLAGARCAVAPMQSGSGVQLKLLEAMAAGVPMVTTPLACRPLGATPGRDLLVGESAAEVASAAQAILTTPDLARDLGRQGRQFVLEHFRWENVNAAFEAVLVEAARTHRAR